MSSSKARTQKFGRSIFQLRKRLRLQNALEHRRKTQATQLLRAKQKYFARADASRLPALEERPMVNF